MLARDYELNDQRYAQAAQQAQQQQHPRPSTGANDQLYDPAAIAYEDAQRRARNAALDAAAGRHPKTTFGGQSLTGENRGIPYGNDDIGGVGHPFDALAPTGAPVPASQNDYGSENVGGGGENIFQQTGMPNGGYGQYQQRQQGQVRQQRTSPETATPTFAGGEENYNFVPDRWQAQPSPQQKQALQMALQSSWR